MPNEIIHIMSSVLVKFEKKWCWFCRAEKPEERPSFAELQKKILELKEEILAVSDGEIQTIGGM